MAGNSYLDDREKYNNENGANNVANVTHVIERIGDRKGVVSIYETDPSRVPWTPCVTVFESKEALADNGSRFQPDGRTLLFKGNAGNIGNYGGGEGLDGENGFGLRITW